MYLVHEIGMRSAGEDSGIKGHAKFELELGGSCLGGTLLVFRWQILSLRIAYQLVAQLSQCTT
jgi:hypothetical protein